MTIITTKAFTYSTDSGLISFAYGTVYEVSETVGAKLISAGLAEEYTGRVIVAQPIGTKEMEFTSNGEYSENVTAYASADIVVDLPDGNEEEY